jgi:hypothetical protein
MIVKIFFARVITDWSGVGQSVLGSQVGEAGLDVGYLTGPDGVGTGDGKRQAEVEKRANEYSRKT